MSIDDPLLLPPPPPPMRRYRLDVEDGTWWELSWHPAQKTFEALHLTRDELGVEKSLAWHGTGVADIASLDELIELVDQPIPDAVVDALTADAKRHYPGLPSQHEAIATPVPEVSYREWLAEQPSRRVPHLDFGMRWTDAAMPERQHRVSWVPDTGELYVTDHEQSYVRVLAVVPTREELEEALAGWATVGARPNPPLAWIEQRAALWLEHMAGDDLPPSVAGVETASPPAPATDHNREHDPSPLAAREAELRGWEARLTAWTQSLYAQAETEPRWSLPAEPATEALRSLLAEPAFATADIEEFARGFGLDPKLADQLITGRITDLDIHQIAQLCHGLHCSPYDLWGSELARSILHAYGPERWPRHIEPLDEGRHPPDAGEFTTRRLDVQAAELSGPLATVAAAWAASATADATREPTETTVEATCYRRTAVLAIDGDGQTSIVDDTAAPPTDAVEYHFSFRQMTEPLPLTVRVTSSEFATGPLPGFDVIPHLAEAAEQLRGHSWLADAEMIRFHDPATSADQWLGWDPEVGGWQTWDDPRRYYPGDPVDVLDPGVFPTDRTPPGASVELDRPQRAVLASGDELDPDEIAAAAGNPYHLTDDGPITIENDDDYKILEPNDTGPGGLRPGVTPEPFDGPSLDL